MRAMNVANTFVVLVLTLLCMAGCGNVCDRMCDAQADLMEGCFDTWESSWQEQSFSGREAYLARCYSVWGDAFEDLDKESTDRQQFQVQCETQLEVALADSDCESLLLIDP